MTVDREALLARLSLRSSNPGACTAPEGWRGSGAEIAVVNPSDGSAIARVTGASGADYDAVLASAEAAARAWREVPAPKRGEAVRRLGLLLRDFKDPLGTLVSLENGKIKAEGDGEVQEMIDIADFAVGQSRMLYGKTMHSERPAHRMYEQWHPLGVVGVITAFNFPVAVWAWNALLAAVCGNATVWKPSPKTPLSAIAVQYLCNRIVAELGLPSVFTLLVDAGRDAGTRLAADPRVALLSFTGSSAVGRQVAEAVARRFGRTLLECSGNNAIIVTEDADLDLVVPAVLFGAVGTAGQRCTTTRRLIVHESIEPELVRRLRAAYAQVRIGDPLDPSTLMGPLIDAAAVGGYQKAVEEAAAAGGELICGGKVRGGSGFFVEPTIIRKARNEWPVVQRETFAPILYVISYRGLDDAIALQNGVPQGLSSALFTGSVRNAEKFLSASGSDCGIANVNIGTSGAEIGGAFGGEKETGGGREAGSDAWQAYMRRQTTTINWSRELPLAQGIKFGET
jgi:aldehyde dehydrogenase (NAD+)